MKNRSVTSCLPTHKGVSAVARSMSGLVAASARLVLLLGQGVPPEIVERQRGAVHEVHVATVDVHDGDVVVAGDAVDACFTQQRPQRVDLGAEPAEVTQAEQALVTTGAGVGDEGGQRMGLA